MCEICSRKLWFFWFLISGNIYNPKCGRWWWTWIIYISISFWQLFDGYTKFLRCQVKITFQKNGSNQIHLKSLFYHTDCFLLLILTFKINFIIFVSVMIMQIMALFLRITITLGVLVIVHQPLRLQYLILVLMEVEENPAAQAPTHVEQGTETATLMMTALAIWNVARAMVLITTVIIH